MRLRTSLQFALAALLIGASGALAAEPVTYGSLSSFNNSKIRSAEQVLIQTQGDFESYWRRHAGNDEGRPTVDFTREWVIAVVLGEQPSLGYSACVDRISREGQVLDVLLRKTAPPPDTFVSMALSSPGCFVRIPQQPITSVNFHYPPTQTSRTNLPMRTLSQISNSLILNSRFVIAQDPESFRLLWIEHAGSDESMPAVDFSQEMVIAAFMGEQPTGGFALSIADVSENNGKLAVKVAKSAPSPDQLVIQMLTAPAHLIAVPRRDMPVEFE